MRFRESEARFRFVLRPHRGTTAAEAARFATGFSQPLVAVPGRGAVPRAMPLLQIEPADVLVSGLKSSDDGKAIIVRLFNAGAQPAAVKLLWSAPAPKQVWLSDTSERPLQEVAGEIPILAWGLVTLRAEWPE